MAKTNSRSRSKSNKAVSVVKSEPSFSKYLEDSLNKPPIQISLAVAGIFVMGSLGYYLLFPTKKTKPAQKQPIEQKELEQYFAVALKSLQTSDRQTKTGLEAPNNPQPPTEVTVEFEVLYKIISSGAPPEAYPPSSRSLIANFLLMYYACIHLASHQDGPQVLKRRSYLTHKEANQVRKWATWNISELRSDQLDLLHRIAWREQSMSNLRSLNEYMIKLGAPSRGENGNDVLDVPYSQKRFELACIFGEWDDIDTYGKQLENVVDRRTRVPLLASYMTRTFQQPSSICNYSQIYEKREKYSLMFPKIMMPPARFEEWDIHKFKFKNLSTPQTPNSDLPMEGDWVVFYDSTKEKVAESIRKMFIFGSIAQTISPIQGLVGLLPITGPWNDTEMNLTVEWSFSPQAYQSAESRRGPAIVVKKTVELHLERGIPQRDIQRGWIWNGNMLVTTSKGTQRLNPQKDESSILWSDHSEIKYSAELLIASRD